MGHVGLKFKVIASSMKVCETYFFLIGRSHGELHQFTVNSVHMK